MSVVSASLDQGLRTKDGRRTKDGPRTKNQVQRTSPSMRHLVNQVIHPEAIGIGRARLAVQPFR